MKKVYERPIMKAEVYQTNAYCGACADKPPVLTGTLTVSLDQGNWYSNNNGLEWNGNPNSYDTDHTFIEANKIAQKSNYGNLDQYYWECSCCPEGSKYYLEYSANFTENYNNGTPTFFLYQEANNREGLQLASAKSWPHTGRNIDTCVAQVRYTQDSSPVINS